MHTHCFHRLHKCSLEVFPTPVKKFNPCKEIHHYYILWFCSINTHIARPPSVQFCLTRPVQFAPFVRLKRIQQPNFTFRGVSRPVHTELSATCIVTLCGPIQACCMLMWLTGWMTQSAQRSQWGKPHHSISWPLLHTVCVNFWALLCLNVTAEN